MTPQSHRKAPLVQIHLPFPLSKSAVVVGFTQSSPYCTPRTIFRCNLQKSPACAPEKPLLLYTLPLLCPALRVIYSDAALESSNPRAPGDTPCTHQACALEPCPGAGGGCACTHAHTHNTTTPAPNTYPHTLYKCMYEHVNAGSLPPSFPPHSLMYDNVSNTTRDASRHTHPPTRARPHTRAHSTSPAPHDPYTSTSDVFPEDI